MRKITLGELPFPCAVRTDIDIDIALLKEQMLIFRRRQLFFRNISTITHQPYQQAVTKESNRSSFPKLKLCEINAIEVLPVPLAELLGRSGEDALAKTAGCLEETVKDHRMEWVPKYV